jgi:hypothetical protein
MLNLSDKSVSDITKSKMSSVYYVATYGDRDQQQVFILDDVLGIFAVDMNIYNHIINIKEPIFKAIGVNPPVSS